MKNGSDRDPHDHGYGAPKSDSTENNSKKLKERAVLGAETLMAIGGEHSHRLQFCTRTNIWDRKFAHYSRHFQRPYIDERPTVTVLSISTDRWQD